MRKSVVNQTEIAFTAYIEAIQNNTVAPPPENPTANVTLGPVNVYAFQQVIPITNPNPGQNDIFENVTLPSLIFKGDHAEQYVLDCGVYELNLTAMLETQVDDEQDTPGQDIHHERVEALRDCLEDFYVIQPAINAPVSGPDTRAVQNYTLSAILYNDETEELKDRRFITTMHYVITACPQDAPS